MKKALFTLSIITCLSVNNLFCKSIEQEMQPHNHYKNKAIEEAESSQVVLEDKFNLITKELKDKPSVDEDEYKHNENILKFIKQNQEDWLLYRYSYCQTQAYIEIFPASSGLFVQVLYNCITELNKQRIVYLENMMQELKIINTKEKERID